jgi:hypothetical protein
MKFRQYILINVNVAKLVTLDALISYLEREREGREREGREREGREREIGERLGPNFELAQQIYYLERERTEIFSLG